MSASDGIGLDGEAREDVEREPWWALALKVGLAMALADAAARLAGFPAATLAVITAGFVSAQPPATSVGMALRRWLASMLGVAMGATAGWAVRAFAPATGAALLIGAVAGGLRSRSIDYLYVAVVGIVVAFTIEDTDRAILAVAGEKALLVTIGCVAAPLVVLAVERARGR